MTEEEEIATTLLLKGMYTLNMNGTVFFCSDKPYTIGTKRDNFVKKKKIKKKVGFSKTLGVRPTPTLLLSSFTRLPFIHF